MNREMNRADKRKAVKVATKADIIKALKAMHEKQGQLIEIVQVLAAKVERLEGEA